MSLASVRLGFDPFLDDFDPFDPDEGDVEGALITWDRRPTCQTPSQASSAGW